MNRHRRESKYQRHGLNTIRRGLKEGCRMVFMRASGKEEAEWSGVGQHKEQKGRFVFLDDEILSSLHSRKG
jgi:hypothetical protein